MEIQIEILWEVQEADMPKLSDYVKMAADEYMREHANSEPSARWIAAT